MNLQPTTRLTVPAHVYARSFDAELVLLDFAKGEFFGLDEVGAVLWASAERGGTIREAVSKVVESFGSAEPAEVERDLLQLTSTLVDAGLLVCD